jgi:hypothetical protein
LLSYIENADGTPNTTIDVKTLAESEPPISFSYPGRYKNQSNWFVPNKSCLKGWLTAPGFDLQYLLELNPQPRSQRIIIAAKKTGQPIIEHKLV